VIRFCCSNRLEALVEALADTVGAGRTSLFDPMILVVPNALVEGYVKQGLARRLGIAAHVETGFLRGFLRKVAAASAPDAVIADRDILEGALLELFHDQGWLGGPELGPVRDYLGAGAGDLDADARDRKRVQLAAELAVLLDEYAFSRPEMLAAWREGALASDADATSQRWQREIWQALHGPRGRLAARGVVTLPDFFARTPAAALRPPPAAHLFGISYVARLYGAIFETLGQATDLFVYTLSPDRVTAAGRSAASGNGSPLDPWGRPGRDNIELLARLTGGAVDARFVEPPGGARASRLAALQKAVLDRGSVPRRKRAADDSLTVVPAADPRRELETIAAEIWSRVRADDTLTFADVAVVVPKASADVYLPLAQAVFDQASHLPHTIIDLPRPTERRISDVVGLLLELPLGSLGRPDLLRVAMHPTVARRFPDVDPEEWLALCEELEIVRGAHRADQPESYLERDRTSWDQGLRRLALGAFLSGPHGGEERPFVLDGEAILPFDVAPDREPAARALGIIARELCAFAHAARTATGPFETHATLLRRTIAHTILTEPGDEEAALGDALRAIEAVEALLPKALPVSYRVAAELVKARLGETPRRHRVPEGVTVASFVPMRALPFRHIFVAGLDERVFPATAGGRALDLRTAARHPGDVSPREQDEHMFLETLLAARERITLSYVARDPVTGEERSPSSVLRRLLDLLEPERTADAPSEISRPRPPLARHEDPAATGVIPASARERRAATLGASLRRAGGGGPQLPALSELRAKLAPSVWSTVAAELDWVAPPLSTRIRARRGLTLADLRRFLECPLQASARVLLPVGDDDDAAAEAEAAVREHEPLDEARVRTVPFLRDVAGALIGAAEGPGDAALEAAYDRQAERQRLAGVLPDGLFGRALRERHLAVLRCWRDGIQLLPGGLRTAPAPLWLGAAPEHRRDVTRVSPVPLMLADGTTVALGGRSSLCAEGGDGARVVLSLIASTTRDYVERDLLEPFFTHLALSAMGGGHAERATHAVIIRPKDGDGTPRLDERRFGPVDAETARAYLGALASELVGAPHAYFLPCEGVFTWKRRVDDEETMTVRDAVLLLRDDNWTRFASDRGPIPDPREYPVPSESEAAAVVERRFRPYLAAIARDQAAPKRSKKR
jgi:exodeoxyribonuclease V gamma subunit